MSFDDTNGMVTAVLEQHEGQYESLGGADLTRRRQKIEGNVRRAVSKVWYYKDWPWSWVSDGVSILADEDIVMPSNFKNFGREGGIWHDSAVGTRPLQWMPFHRFKDLAFSRPRSGTPSIYTLGTQESPQTVAGEVNMFVQLYPFNDGPRDFGFEYRSLPPVIDDTGTGGGGGDELERIPEPWRSDVIWEWVIYYQMRDKGNIQGRGEQQQVAMEAMKQMAYVERAGTESPHYIAPFGIRRGGGAGRILST